jgi:glycosyltransferase involved in cell wall biosynthesis
MTGQPAPIAYFTQVFPGLTQTFVYREVQALRDLGVPVHTFSVWRPKPAELSAETRPLANETFYIFPVSWRYLLSAHLRYLLTRPLRYGKTLAFLLSRPGEPMGNRWRSLLHFVYGMSAIRSMQEGRVGHIHVHFAWSAASIALIADRLLGIPFSLTLHSKEIYAERLLLVDKIRYAQFVVTISEYNRQLLRSLLPQQELYEKIHVIRCGLNPSIFTRSEEGSPAPEFTIVGVGQLVPRKGFHVLVEACHYLASRGMRFRCHIVGEGPERDRLEGSIEHYDLQDQVRLPGLIYQAELKELLQQADVFALPCVRDERGDQDGIPVVLMEALSMELATVSTDISGIPELIEDGHSGLLVPWGDAPALADALQRLSDDPGLRRRLGRAGRETILRHFDIRRSAEQMAALLQAAASGDP